MFIYQSPRVKPLCYAIAEQEISSARYFQIIVSQWRNLLQDFSLQFLHLFVNRTLAPLSKQLPPRNMGQNDTVKQKEGAFPAFW
jgi:hypothetical protein